LKIAWHRCRACYRLLVAIPLTAVGPTQPLTECRANASPVTVAYGLPALQR
jgi:hypothetical protein